MIYLSRDGGRPSSAIYEMNGVPIRTESVTVTSPPEVALSRQMGHLLSRGWDEKKPEDIIEELAAHEGDKSSAEGCEGCGGECDGAEDGAEIEDAERTRFVEKPGMSGTLSVTPLGRGSSVCFVAMKGKTMDAAEKILSGNQEGIPGIPKPPGAKGIACIKGMEDFGQDVAIMSTVSLPEVVHSDQVAAMKRLGWEEKRVSPPGSRPLVTFFTRDDQTCLFSADREPDGHTSVLMLLTR